MLSLEQGYQWQYNTMSLALFPWQSGQMAWRLNLVELCMHKINVNFNHWLNAFALNKMGFEFPRHSVPPSLHLSLPSFLPASLFPSLCPSVNPSILPPLPPSLPPSYPPLSPTLSSSSPPTSFPSSLAPPLRSSLPFPLYGRNVFTFFLE